MSKIRLLMICCWVQAKLKQISNLSVCLGKKQPILRKNYIPNNKIYLFESASQSILPLLTVIYNEQIYQLSFNRSQIPTINPIVKEMSNQFEDFKIFVTAQFLSNTDKVYDKYCVQKSDEQRLSYCEGIDEFIRSQAQFCSIFQRDDDIYQIRQCQIQQKNIQEEFTRQMIILNNNAKIDYKKVMVILLLFLFFGIMMGRMREFYVADEYDKEQRNHNKKKISKVQIKNNQKVNKKKQSKNK